MRTLVTGANGFVGSHVVDELLGRGHDVRCLVRTTSDLSFLPTDRVELVHGDMATGQYPDGSLDDIDTLFHIAAVLMAVDEATYRRVNLEGTLALYRAFAAKADQGARFVFCSSLAAIGPSDGTRILTERDAPHPISPYGHSKLEAEVALAALSGPQLTIIRPPAVYGPRDRATLPLFELAAKGWTLCFGSANRPLSMIHVEDLARAMVEAAGHPGGVGTFFVTDGNIESWGSLSDAIASGSGRKTRRLTLPDALVRGAAAVIEGSAKLTGKAPIFTREKAADFTARSWACSSEAAMEAFGYRPRLNVVDGMAESFQWYRKEGWL